MYLGMYVNLLRVVPPELYQGGPEVVRREAPGLWNSFKFHPRVRELVRDGMDTEAAVAQVVFQMRDENFI